MWTVTWLQIKPIKHDTTKTSSGLVEYKWMAGGKGMLDLSFEWEYFKHKIVIIDQLYTFPIFFVYYSTLTRRLFDR